MTATTNSFRRKVLLGTALAAAMGSAFVGGGMLMPNQSALAAGPVAVQPVVLPSFADLAEKVSPAVVSVRVRANGRTANAQDFFGGPPGGDPFPGLPQDSPLRRFFGNPDQNQGGRNAPRPQGRQGVSLGSGFFVSEDGYIVTNNHVVDNGIDFTIITDDGTQYTAKLVGKDDKTDVAVLKVDANRPFTYVKFAEDSPRVGDWVVAVGNPFGLGGTVTAGIVSARGRQIGSGPYDDYLQIDAPVNRGNSGGPTFNIRGEVVGINTAIYSPSGGSVGIAFDIPAATAAKVVNDLRTNGTIVRGWLGVQIQPVNATIADSLRLRGTKGALVSEPQAGSPAEASGIKAGDVILSIDGRPVADPRELALMVASYPPNASVKVAVWRDGAQQEITVKLGKLPSDQQLAAVNPGNDRAAPGNTGRNANQGTQLQGLGVTLTTSRDAAGGVLISRIDPNGVAAQAGLDVGDVILTVGGTKVANAADVDKAVNQAKQQGLKAVLLRVKSGDDTQFVALPLG
ncbi:MAG: Do family serine endopeptidase [Bauldia sp.]